jgi:hypothetical protein
MQTRIQIGSAWAYARQSALGMSPEPLSPYASLKGGTYDRDLNPVRHESGFYVATGPILPTSKYIGVWTAPDGSRLVEDVLWVADETRARILGRDYAQKAIWDCAANCEVWL